MKRKIISLTLIAVIVMAMTACGNKAASDTIDTDNTVSSTDATAGDTTPSTNESVDNTADSDSNATEDATISDNASAEDVTDSESESGMDETVLAEPPAEPEPEDIPEDPNFNLLKEMIRDQVLIFDGNRYQDTEEIIATMNPVRYKTEAVNNLDPILKDGLTEEEKETALQEFLYDSNYFNKYWEFFYDENGVLYEAYTHPAHPTGEFYIMTLTDLVTDETLVWGIDVYVEADDIPELYQQWQFSIGHIYKVIYVDELENFSESITALIDSVPSTWDEPRDIAYSGRTVNCIGEGFDHIKVPCLDKYNRNSFAEETANTAFDFDTMPDDWEDDWWNTYEEFLIANGSPLDSDGTPLGAFTAIHEGFSHGCQYLYYGVNFSWTSSGVGDINLYPDDVYSWSNAGTEKYYEDCHVVEIANFSYGDNDVDARIENDYRSATLLMLSWVCPNPDEIEQVIYDFISDDDCTSTLGLQVLNCSWGSWMQVGETDICAWFSYPEDDHYGFIIREHRDWQE